MKKISILFFICLLSFFLISCTNKKIMNEANPSDSSELSLEEVEDLYERDKDNIESLFSEENKFNYVSTNETEYIKLFYADSQGLYWLIEEKQLVCDPKIVVEALISSPNSPALNDVELLGLIVKDNMAYVNVSESIEFSLIDKLGKGDNVVMISLETIVNTLCLNDSLNIDSVLFLVEGRLPLIVGSSVNFPYRKPNMELLPIQ